MEVFQVISIAEVKNLADRSKSYIGDEQDRGLFVSFDAADQFIEKFTKDQLYGAVKDGDGAWIGAYQKEEYDGTIGPIFRKSILISDRKNSQYMRFDYYVKRRTVKELA